VRTASQPETVPTDAAGNMFETAVSDTSAPTSESGQLRSPSTSPRGLFLDKGVRLHAELFVSAREGYVVLERLGKWGGQDSNLRLEDYECVHARPARS
jgi:hypothetical protein